MVVQVPPSASLATTVDWLVRAVAVVSTVPVTGRWEASVYSVTGRSTNGP
jgi:hypothetical protein